MEEKNHIFLLKDLESWPSVVKTGPPSKRDRPLGSGFMAAMYCPLIRPAMKTGGWAQVEEEFSVV